ncbi:MAG: imidazoleglycerol-phosphate dehydratase HisB [Kiritimatiellae bacterium]|nr:imidazoleglycerol-phosphate dehydratase HisB [Kiritimatiellia bacterium]
MNRTATQHRQTRETDIELTLAIDGTGRGSIETGIPFMNHMLELFARHALMDLDVKASGDLAVDYHHTVEDLGLVLGACLDQALVERRGIRRYGFSLLPMDESLSQVAVDLGGRPFLVYDISNRKRRIRDFDVQLIEEFFRALVTQARMNLHIRHLYGDEVHHAYESVFKGFARALRMAVESDPRESGIPSSKGTI